MALSQANSAKTVAAMLVAYGTSSLQMQHVFLVPLVLGSGSG